MINIKEIVNRKCDVETKETIAFEYILKGLEGPHGETQELRIWFERVKPEDYGMITNHPTYKVFTIIDSVVYEKIYGMPKSGMSLMMVAATGLNLLRSSIQEELAYKEMLGYTILDVIKDM